MRVKSSSMMRQLRAGCGFVLVPFLPVINGMGGLGDCVWNGYAARLKQLMVEIERIGTSKPIVLTCTCVQQRNLFSPGLHAWLQSRPNLVQLSHAPRFTGTHAASGASDRVVVVPYHAGEPEPTRCRSNGVIYWAGSAGVKNKTASAVRRKIMELGKHNRSGLLRTYRSSRRYDHED